MREVSSFSTHKALMHEENKKRRPTCFDVQDPKLKGYKTIWNSTKGPMSPNQKRYFPENYLCIMEERKSRLTNDFYIFLDNVLWRGRSWCHFRCQTGCWARLLFGTYCGMIGFWLSNFLWPDLLWAFSNLFRMQKWAEKKKIYRSGRFGYRQSGHILSEYGTNFRGCRWRCSYMATRSFFQC